MSSETPVANGLEPSSSLETTTNSFVVVIRCKPVQPGGPEAKWHGSVEHTQSHERLYFIDYPRLNGFIAARSETWLHPPWRTRLSRRWQNTAVRRWLQRLRSGPSAGPVSGDGG